MALFTGLDFQDHHVFAVVGPCGTGKTFAVTEYLKAHDPQALILTPEHLRQPFMCPREGFGDAEHLAIDELLQWEPHSLEQAVYSLVDMARAHNKKLILIAQAIETVSMFKELQIDPRAIFYSEQENPLDFGVYAFKPLSQLTSHASA